MNNVEIYQGDSWEPAIAVEKKDAVTLVKSAFNCTGYTAYLLLKTGFNAALTAIAELAVAWSNQAGGAGSFALTNAVSRTLTPARYAYEVKLVKDDGTKMYTLDQGYLTVLPALETEIIN